MSDKKRDTMLDPDVDFDDVPTERFEVPQETTTDPAQSVGVLNADVAEAIRAEHEATVLEETRLTFTGTIDAEGRIVISKAILKTGNLKPGDELIIQAEKLT